MSIAFYMDHHVPSAVTRGLRLRGVDCLTAEDDGRADFADPLLLDRATDLGRVIFTQDRDFLAIGAERVAAGIPFAGIVYAAQLRLTIGEMVSDLELLAKILRSARDGESNLVAADLIVG
jgi:predicted nuclease of predicted toxin-antitoxin system